MGPTAVSETSSVNWTSTPSRNPKAKEQYSRNFVNINEVNRRGVNVGWRQGYLSVVKWSEVKVLVKCMCNSSWNCVIHYSIVCLIVINADWPTLVSFLGLNTHFVFIVCVVYVFFCICNFVCCVLFWVLHVILCDVWYFMFLYYHCHRVQIHLQLITNNNNNK